MIFRDILLAVLVIVVTYQTVLPIYRQYEFDKCAKVHGDDSCGFILDGYENRLVRY